MSKTTRKKSKLIAFQEPQISAPQRLRWHFTYVILYELIIIAALWQHGDPIFTISLLALALPLGLSAYIPYRIIARKYRFIAQMLIMICACAWFLFRLHTLVPVDKTLAETVCVAGLCFIFAQRRADYDYLLLVSFFMLLYGSLIPREIFISIYLPSMFLILILFYASRIRSLSRQADLITPQKWIFRNWIFILFHFTIAAVIGWYTFILFPLERSPGEGIFQVSFQTENELMEHINSKTWIKNSKLSIRPEAKRSTIADGKKATDTTEEKKAPINPNAKGSTTKNSPKIQGSGTPKVSEQPGTDLVFRVKSPLKLYWLGKLYDRYDGTEWRQSYQIQNLSVRSYLNNPKIIRDYLEQHFVIEKWFSYTLFSAYRLSSIELNSAQNKGFIFEVNDYSAELLQTEFPALPFRYRATSQITLPAKRTFFGTQTSDYWEERVSRQHYLYLPPRDIISKRLRDKTLSITSGARDPYSKAIKLRDYLRKNYSYKQFADPVPDGKEPADYFVFELKTGHCEYFASALAVMARIVDLPARVATGFSPGNYNALTGYFEVHEYHAHAWTQIFIEGMGWLTFDASPPGAVQSRTTPFGIGSLRDPFGDSWRILPPEITPETQKVIASNIAKRLSHDLNRELNAAEKILLNTAEAPDHIREKVNQQFDRLLPGIAGNGMEKMRTIAVMARDYLKKSFQATMQKFYRSWNWAKNHWFALIPLILMSTALWIGLKIIRHWIFRALHLRRGERHLNVARLSAVSDPGKAVHHAYFSLREHLITLELPRRRNMELMKYGEFAEQHIPELKSQVIPVFMLYSKQTYGPGTANTEDARTTMQCLSQVHSFTMQVLGKNTSLKQSPQKKRQQ